MQKDLYARLFISFLLEERGPTRIGLAGWVGSPSIIWRFHVASGSTRDIRVIDKVTKEIYRIVRIATGLYFLKVRIGSDLNNTVCVECLF